jgi:hypothetical protein
MIRIRRRPIFSAAVQRSFRFEGGVIHRRLEMLATDVEQFVLNASFVLCSVGFAFKPNSCGKLLDEIAHMASLTDELPGRSSLSSRQQRGRQLGRPLFIGERPMGRGRSACGGLLPAPAEHRQRIVLCRLAFC